MNILVVGRDEAMLAQAHEAYEEMGHRVLTATTLEQTMSRIEGWDPSLKNFVLIDRDGFTDADVIEILNRVFALDSSEERDFEWRTTAFLMVAEGSSTSIISDELSLANQHGGVYESVPNTKGAWQDFWYLVFSPVTWASPLENAERNSVRNRIERMFAQLRARFGGRKHHDGGSE